MNVILPVWLIASQWVLLFALGALVIVMYRQLGFLLHLKDIGTEHDGLSLGDRAPAFDYILVKNGLSFRFEPLGSWSLLVFADPGCSSCQGTILALEKIAFAFTKPCSILVVTSADLQLIAVVDAFRTASVNIAQVSKQIPEEFYQTHATPFAYLIDPNGLIQAKGAVSDELAIQKILQKIGRSASNVVSPIS
jgi:hypothetical protein